MNDRNWKATYRDPEEPLLPKEIHSVGRDILAGLADAIKRLLHDEKVSLTNIIKIEEEASDDD